MYSFDIFPKKLILKKKSDFLTNLPNLPKSRFGRFIKNMISFSRGLWILFLLLIHRISKFLLFSVGHLHFDSQSSYLMIHLTLLLFACDVWRKLSSFQCCVLHLILLFLSGINWFHVYLLRLLGARFWIKHGHFWEKTWAWFLRLWGLWGL